MTDEPIKYVTAEDIHAIHDAIVADDPGAEPGVRIPDAAESALEYVSTGYFGQVPETLDEKAVHLLRLLVADHSFVDGNKRTALNTTAAFYAINGYYFDHDRQTKELLKQFARDQSEVAIERAVYHFEANSRPVEEIEDEEIRTEIERLQAIVGQAERR